MNRLAVLGYVLLAIGLVVVGIAIALALSFLTGYAVPPTPFSTQMQTPPNAGVATVVMNLGELANALFVPGLLTALVLGGQVTSDKGVRLIRSAQVLEKKRSQEHS